MDPSDLQILYEDNHIIAVNKMPADLVQGDSSSDVPLSDRLKEYLKRKYGKKGKVFLGVVHRLDRPASGVVLFARTGKALERLNRLFREDQVTKKYWAMVQGRPPKDSGTLVHYLKRNPEQNKSYAYDRRVPGSKESRLSYRRLASLGRYHLLEIELHTGRHHQIRAQLHRIGCHIKGDLKYGFPSSNRGGGIHLHAREVTFIHPVRKVPVTILADPPAETLWGQALRELKEQEADSPAGAGGRPSA